jgi:5'/3'-nucleotidase
MKILLSNDDGILAPGISAMYRGLDGLGDVTVVAPDSVQSATAHAITVLEAINVRRMHVHGAFHGWAIGGRPADCVKIAVAELLESKPDLVVSGINDGANVSTNVLYSGTVAAAAEGALLGMPAVAVSLQRGPETDFDRAADIARKIIDTLLHVGLSAGQLVNINIPNLIYGLPKGVRVATQALQGMVDRYRIVEGENGVRQFTLDGEFAEPSGEHETDLHALTEGYVVVTPLQFDLTDRKRLPELEAVSWPEVG